MSKQLKLETLSGHQKDLFEICVANISQIIESDSTFRMSIAKEIIDFKSKAFGVGFDLGGYEERFCIIHVSKAVGFSIATLSQWIKIFLTIETMPPKVAAEFNDLSYHEKYQIVSDIKANKKKPTEAVKDHFANKSDPVKKKMFYLERYINQSLATSRGLEGALLTTRLSTNQEKIVKELSEKTGLIGEILDRLLMDKPRAIRRKRA